MNKTAVGLVFNSLASHQSVFYAVTRANILLKERHDIDFAAFSEQLSNPCVQLNFASFAMVDLYNWEGIGISTDINTTMYLLKSVGPKRRIFYVQDLEWLRYPQRKSYESLASIYRHPSLELWTRSASHKRFIENNFNVAVRGVCEDFDYRVLLDG